MEMVASNGEDVEKSEPSYSARGNIRSAAPLENRLSVAQKGKHSSLIQQFYDEVYNQEN